MSGRRRGTAILLPLLFALAACRTERPFPPGPRAAGPLARSLLTKGDRERGEGHDEEALATYARVTEEHRDLVPAHLRYVSLLIALGRRSEARRIYAARAARPDATDAERTMAERLATDGSSSALRRVYALAAERSGGRAWWRLALAEVEIAEADAWNRRRQDAVDRGDQAAEVKAHDQAAGALARAQDALTRAEAAGPGLPEVDLYRGLLRAVEGDLLAGAVAQDAAWRAAEDAYARAVARDPELSEAWEGLGDVRLRLGDTRGSLEAFLEAARLRPADATLRESVGVVLHRIGRLSEAAAQYEEAARLAPRDASPLLRLGDARADDGRWEQALEAYREALDRDPTAVEAWYKRAVVLEAMGRLGEARSAYERYLSQGGERQTTVRRRVERLLRAETQRR